MKVVIFCGGLGTRLREETEFRPKPMVAVGDRPVLWHIMRRYAQYGHKEFVLCLGYKGEVIKEYFLNYEAHTENSTIQLDGTSNLTIHRDSQPLGWKVTLADTGAQSQKGARLKKVERFVDADTFMATYGDGVADVDIDKLLAFHKSHGRIATVTGVRPPSLFGELKIKGNKVELFTEKPQTSSGSIISGGFFVFSRRIFDFLSTADECDLERGPLEQIAEQGELMVYEHPGDWACVDTYRDLQHVNSLWSKQQAFWKNW